MAVLFAAGASTVTAAPKAVTEVWGSYEDKPGVVWHSTSAAGPLANGNNDLLAFRVAGSPVYGTGVNAAAVPGAQNTVFKAFAPSVVPGAGGLHGIAASSAWATAPSTRAGFLSDGANGLNLMTAIFNVPNTAPNDRLVFSATLSSAAALTDGEPDVIVTQVGDPAPAGVEDVFFFIDGAGQPVGNSVSLSFRSVGAVGRQQWQFRNPDGSAAAQQPGPRDLRMATLDLAVDFGITSALMGQVRGFVQKLSGSSDIAFIAYNEKAIGVPALSLAKSAVLAADQSTITYSFSVTNTGQTLVTNLTVADPGLPTLVCNTIASLAVNATSSFTCTGNVYTVASADRAAGRRINTATVTGKDPSNRNVTANSQVITPLPNADVGITKGVDNSSPFVGDNVTFTVTVTNTGPSDAADVNVVDTLPAGYTLVSVNPGTGSWSAPNWTLGSLTPGGSATLTMLATVNATGPYSNSATVSTTTRDVNPANNTASITPVPVASADLGITKTVDNAAPFVGDNVSFTITVTNAGPSEATGVNVADVLPVGYSFGSATPSTGRWTAPDWAVGSLAKGASATLTMLATVNAMGAYANSATVSATTRDANPANNTAAVTPVPVASADVGITKTVDIAAPQVGDKVMFAITVMNAGPSDAAGVSVVDKLPPGYTLVSAKPSTGSWTAPDWTVGVLVKDGSATLTMVATVNASGSYTNTATVSAGTRDPNLANNTATAAPETVVPTTPQSVPVNSPWVLAMMAWGMLGVAVFLRRGYR